ncbi:MAG: hypothetical protein K8S16_15515 [Bacteroidales bacterium]|nr:hypothetical protein [Bacteroidales bacterium]
MKILKTISLSFLLLSLLQLHSQDEVMDYKDLQNYLPSSVNGYEAGEPSGSTMNMQGMSFSSAEIEFTNQDGDNVRVTLLDYTSAIMMYQAATAMWTAGMSFEDDESIAKSVKWDDKIVGWEEFRKKDKEANLALGLGNRFFLSIEADNQTGMDFVIDIAKSMALNDLSSK